MMNSGSDHNQSPAGFRYKAFISYRHLPLDKEAAEKIQKSIESYTVPREFRKPDGSRKLGRVFRDDDELPLSASLSDSITYALDHTEYLIVICTPELPRSLWCEREIRYFLETHDRDHVLAVLADGSPAESFSPYLLHTYDDEGNILSDTESLAANIGGPDHKINKKTFPKEMTRIRAALLGVPFDSLWQREKRSRIARFASVMGAVTVALAAFLAVTISQNSRIRQMNQEITAQNRDLERQKSSILVDEGTAKLALYDYRGAAGSALEALKSGDPGIYDHRAEKLLADSLGAYTRSGFRSELLYEQTTNISALASDAAGSRAWLADIVGNITCVDLSSGNLLWTAPSVIGSPYEAQAPVRMYPAENADLLICKNFSNIAALSLDDGSLVWNYVYRNGNTFFAISDDGSQIAVFDRDTYREGFDPADPFSIATYDDYDHQTELILLNTSDGSEKGRRRLVSDEDHRVLYGPQYYYGAGFSESGNTIACAFAYAEKESSYEGRYEYILVDTASMEQIREGTAGYKLSTTDLFYGLAIDEETSSLLAAQYSTNDGGIYVTLFHGDTGQVEYRFQEQQLDFFYFQTQVAYQPMICSDHLAVFCSADLLYVIDRDDISRRNSMEVGSDILDIGWLEKEEEIISFITAEGVCAQYDLAHEGQYWRTDYSQNRLSQQSVALARLVCGGTLAKEEAPVSPAAPGSGYLLITSDNPGDLVRVLDYSDPHCRTAALPENTSAVYVCSSPSGKTLFLLRLNYGDDTREWTLSAFDPLTGEQTGSNTFAGIDLYASDIQSLEALNEESVITHCYVLPLDGETELLKACRKDSLYTFVWNSRNCRLNNGKVLSTGLVETAESVVPYAAIDGETVDSLYESGNAALFEDCNQIESGSNGFVLGWSSVPGKKAGFVLFDVQEEKSYEVNNAQPDASEYIISLGTCQPVFVCGDNTGNVLIYDVLSGSSRQLCQNYTVGEIMDVRFLPGDEQVLILTLAGRIDIRDVRDGSLVFSGTAPSVQSARQISANNGILFQCTCEKDAGSGRLYLLIEAYANNTGHIMIGDIGYRTISHGGELIGIDPENRAMLFSTKTDDFLGWSRAGDRIYGFKNNTLFSFPAYKLDDLAGWAGKMLADPAD